MKHPAQTKLLTPQHNSARRGDFRFSYADIEKARKILIYELKFNLKEGLAKLVEWTLKHER